MATLILVVIIGELDVPFKLNPKKSIYISMHKIISITVLCGVFESSITSPVYANRLKQGMVPSLPVPE